MSFGFCQSTTIAQVELRANCVNVDGCRLTVGVAQIAWFWLHAVNKLNGLNARWRHGNTLSTPYND